MGLIGGWDRVGRQSTPRLIHLLERHPMLTLKQRRISAATTVRTPDAVQLAVALTSHCAAFVTNDRRLPAVPAQRIVDLAGG